MNGFTLPYDSMTDFQSVRVTVDGLEVRRTTTHAERFD